MIDDPEIKKIVRAAVDDAYRLGIGAAIETIQRYRGQSIDVETFDEAIHELRRQSAGAEKP